MLLPRFPVVLAVALASLGFACERRPSPGAVSVDIAPTPPPAAVSVEPAPAEPLPVPPVPGSVPTPVAPAAPPPPLDVQAWLSEHNVVARDFLYSDCRATPLGRPPLDGLVCLGGPPMEGSLRSGHSVFPMAALVAEAGKLRIVMRTAVMAGPMDPMGDGDPAYVRLVVEVGRDGTRIEVRDTPGSTCADALAKAANLGDPPTVRMVRLACASRGAYAWTRGRFARVP